MQLFFREFGKGYPIIILHGLYGSSDNWISIGKSLAKEYKVYLIDQRNHGQSPHSSSHTYHDLKNDLSNFIDERKLEKVTLIGHSMGGKAAMFFSALFPEKIKHLIVIDISPKDYTKVAVDAPQTSKHRIFLKAMKELDVTTLKYRIEADEKLSEQIQKKRTRQFLLKNLKRTKDKSFRWKINLPVIITHLNEMLKGIPITDKGITKFPVLFIRGEQSRYILTDDHLTIRNIFPNAEITTIPKSGHWIHSEQPNLLIKTIYYFIDR